MRIGTVWEQKMVSKKLIKFKCVFCLPMMFQQSTNEDFISYVGAIFQAQTVLIPSIQIPKDHQAKMVIVHKELHQNFSLIIFYANLSQNLHFSL